MTNVVQVKPIFPALRAKELLRAGKNEQAIAGLESHLSANAGDHASWHQLAVAETQLRHYFKALKAIKRALILAPAEAAYERQYALTLVNLGRCDEATEVLLPMLQSNPQDYFVLHALQIAYNKAGKQQHAIALGRKILKIEDRAAVVKPLQPVSGQSIPVRRGSRKIVAYSLWGANPVYNYGAMINAQLVQFIYPGWRCRFYLGQNVPALTNDILRRSGAEVIEAAEKYADVAPAMWRFLAADDPSVAIFLCRDCDARISPKEAAAVDIWLRSGKRAHVMRDHVLHRNLILAGMWGARTEKSLCVAERMKRYSSGSADARYGSDQRFLAHEIWPEIRDDCMIHDSYYDLFGAQPFPVMGKGNDRFHVGMGVIGEDGLHREAEMLGLPWPPAAG